MCLFVEAIKDARFIGNCHTGPIQTFGCQKKCQTDSKCKFIIWQGNKINNLCALSYSKPVRKMEEMGSITARKCCFDNENNTILNNCV